MEPKEKVTMMISQKWVCVEAFKKQDYLGRKKTCMEAHMALKKLTMTKVRMVNHCSLVKEANADIAMFSY